MFSYGVLHSLNRVLPAPNPAELNSQIQEGLHAGFISANRLRCCFRLKSALKLTEQ